MASEKTEIDAKTMDRRVAARLIRRGLLSERDLEKAIKLLPDVSDKGEVVETKLGDEDDDIDEE